MLRVITPWSFFAWFEFEGHFPKSNVIFSYIYLHYFNESYISVYPDLPRPILVRPSSEKRPGSKGLRSVRMDAP